MDDYEWGDDKWIYERNQYDWMHAPVSVYEVHLGSWRRRHDGSFMSYDEIADELVPYLVHLGYTHVEFLPISEHPLDESWGYQVSGYFAPTSRFGDPDGFRRLVDRLHQANIGVFLDWVPAHFPKDEFALSRFTGEPCYEYAEPEKGEHADWGTLIFNYGRNEVRNFLISNAVYWSQEFHIDGLRVDAVASMLYLDYSRNHGQWSPNMFGGREHLEAVDFLKEFNIIMHRECPGTVTLAEESTDWPQVSRPVDHGGLGFSMKWNMGWMHDTLAYMQSDPVYRRFHQNQLTFSQLYAYNENFILPLSHDEVVHMKRSMLDKMPGDRWQKFANLRCLYGYQYAHPGKKLMFMGSEFGQWNEWDESQALDWMVAPMEGHDGLSILVKDLNNLYRTTAALHTHDFESEGFEWIDCDDHDQSVMSFMRRGAGEFIVCVLNLTPIPRQDYLVGVPVAGDYVELLNTDAECYGGSGLGNSGRVSTNQEQHKHFSDSLRLTLPPLSCLIFKMD